VYRLVNTLIKHGLDVVHLSSCMLMEDAYPKCPNLDSIRKTIKDAGIEVVEGTHH
jgi:predicted metal-binding protein